MSLTEETELATPPSVCSALSIYMSGACNSKYLCIQHSQVCSYVMYCIECVLVITRTWLQDCTLHWVCNNKCRNFLIHGKDELFDRCHLLAFVHTGSIILQVDTYTSNMLVALFNLDTVMWRLMVTTRHHSDFVRTGVSSSDVSPSCVCPRTM